MKLTYVQILTFHDIISRLDNPKGQPVKDYGKEDQPPIEIKYKFKGNVIYNLARNVRKLKEAIQDITKTRQDIFNKYRKENENELSGENLTKFRDEYGEFLNSTTELDLRTVTIEDLELDKNPIPITFMSDLMDGIIVESK